MPVIPLKAYRVAPRKPWVAVEGGLVTFRLPSFLGGKTFSTPVANVGVVDPRLVGEGLVAEDVVFEVPLVVPYAFTTSAMTEPNVGLVFREPVRLPEKKLFRSTLDSLAPKRGAIGGLPPGRYLDGLVLRAEDQEAAIAAFAEAGAERVYEPEAWFVAHRARQTDSREIERVVRRDRTGARIERVTWVLMPAGLAVAAFGGLTGREPLVTGGMTAGGAGLALTAVWEWWADRQAFRRSR